MRTLLAGIAAVSTAAALAGCSNGSDDTPEQAPTSAAAEATSDASAAETSGTGSSTGEDVDLADHTFSTTAQDAIDIATKEAGEGTVHAIELDWEREHSAWVWQVKTLVDKTDHEVDINADSGEVIKHEQDGTDDTEKAITLDEPMTFDDAKAKALEKREGRITGWKYEWDDSKLEYQFDIEHNGNDEEVTVDAESGDVRED